MLQSLKCGAIIKNQTLKNFSEKMVLSFHQQNIRFIAIEMFKVFKGISPQIVKETFQFRDAVPYQLKKNNFHVLSVSILFQ